jgi:hypothetical protein
MVARMRQPTASICDALSPAGSRARQSGRSARLLQRQKLHGSGSLGAVEAEELAATRRLRGASLAQARLDPLAVLALIGDSGGTIYLTAPVRLVACEDDALKTLLSDLDSICWTCGEVASIDFEHHAIGGHVSGGCGGGPVIDGVWVHPKFFDDEVRRCASEVVLGTRSRLPGALLRDRRAAEVEARRKSRMKPDSVARRAQHSIPWDFDIFPPLIPFPDADD